jgi:hypothetical protein
MSRSPEAVRTLDHMMRTFVPTVAVLALLGLAAPAGAQTTTTTAASSAGSTTTSSPDDWASGVCSSVSTWLDSVDDTVKGLTSADSLDDAATQARTGVKDATDTLATSISDLGRPSTGDGKKAKKQIDQLTDQLDSLSQSIQEALSDPGSNPVQIAGTLAQVGSDVGKAVSEVQSTATALKGLKPNGALKQAFKTEPACKQLKKRL